MADAPGYAALLDDLDAEETELDAVVAELTGDAWSTATPAAGWDVRDTIAHLAVGRGAGERSRSATRRRSTPSWRGCSPTSTRPATSSTARGRATAPAPRCSPGGATRVATARSRCSPSARAARPGPVGGGSDVGDVVRDRAAHGDVGPRRQDVVRRARGRAGADGPPAPHRRARRPHPRLRLRRARARPARPATCASSSPDPTARRGRGASRRPTSCAVPPSTSASSSRSAATSPTPRSRSSGPLASRVDADRPGVRRARPPTPAPRT